jgi:hypothetical protein
MLAVEDSVDAPKASYDVTIVQVESQRRAGRGLREPLDFAALLTVWSNGRTEIKRDRGIVNFEMRVLDPATGGAVSFGQDPERWARNLPQEYRTPRLRACVTNVPAATAVAPRACRAAQTAVAA